MCSAIALTGVSGTVTNGSALAVEKPVAAVKQRIRVVARI
jgi:hypothetical protein